MEDCNMLVSDCIVISCCCQCLILQIIVFIFLKLPQKLIRKTKEYAKKKLRSRRRKGDKKNKAFKGRIQDEFIELHRRSISIRIEDFSKGKGHGFEYCCMEEVERVLEELSQKGEFAFGSFWRREGSDSPPTSLPQQEFRFSFVQYELVEIAPSSSLCCS